MQHHQGRLIDHVQLRVSDLEASRRPYRAVLKASRHDLTSESPQHFARDGLWSARRRPHGGSARDPESVDPFHEAASHDPAERSAESAVVRSGKGRMTCHNS